MRNFITSSLFAGLLIGIAGLVFLHVGGLDEGRGFGELGGAVLFAFGLMSVSVSKALLFTGKAGYLPYKESLQLIPMVLLNAVGCFVAHPDNIDRHRCHCDNGAPGRTPRHLLTAALWRTGIYHVRTTP